MIFELRIHNHEIASSETTSARILFAANGLDEAIKAIEPIRRGNPKHTTSISNPEEAMTFVCLMAWEDHMTEEKLINDQVNEEFRQDWLWWSNLTQIRNNLKNAHSIASKYGHLRHRLTPEHAACLTKMSTF